MEINSQLKSSCRYCGKQFMKHSNLTQHERIHTGEKPFICQVCKKSFSQKSNMKKHYETHKMFPEPVRSLKVVSEKEKAANATKIHICQFCTVEFTSYLNLKKHLSEEHQQIKVFKCLVADCGKVFTSIENFTEHGVQHNKKSCCLQIDDPCNCQSGAWQCSQCDAVFKSLEKLERHKSVETHHHPCSICKAVFKRERYLRRHMSKHCDNNLNCEICDKPYKSLQALKNHLSLHDADGGHLCSICGTRFPNFYGLKRHVAKHAERLYKCTYRKSFGCEKTFYRKDKLQTHIKTHQNSSTSIKRRACDVQSDSDNSTVINIEIFKVDPS